MDISATLIPGPQPFELVQPRQGSFHHPAIAAQTTAVWGATASQHRFDAAVPQPTAMLVGVIGLIPLETLGPSARSAPFTPYGWDGFHQQRELGNVIGVGTSHLGHQRDALCVRDHVVLAALFGAIGGIGARLGPPFTARREALSITARDQSSWSAPCKRASNTSCRCCHTPAAFQSRKRRQQVMPEPQPISWGKSSQPMPVLSTNRIPVSACRLPILGLAPGYRKRRSLAGGNKGSTTSHRLSSKSGFAIAYLSGFFGQADFTRKESFC